MRRIARLALRFVALVATAAVACAAAPAGGRPPVPVAHGVSVNGVELGGLTWQPARERLQRSFAKPLRFVFQGERWSVSPERLGAGADLDATLDDALRARPGRRVALRVTVPRTRVQRYARSVARRLYRAPENAHFAGLVDLQPSFTEPRPGRRVLRERLERGITWAIRSGDRRPIEVPDAAVPAEITAAEYGPVIVIRREARQLYLYDGPQLVRTFRVAVGQPEYPTPLGTFSITIKDRNPWWRPPPSDWAEGLEPVPPGPGNPLGTRWMGLSGYSVGIHATPDAASVGYSASHGCIRMYMAEAEWLFDRVYVGTPVVIVSA